MLLHAPVTLKNSTHPHGSRLSLTTLLWRQPLSAALWTGNQPKTLAVIAPAATQAY